MKLLQLLPLAVLSASFIIPDEGVLADIAIETQGRAKSWLERLPSKEEITSIIKSPFEGAKEAAINAFDEALAYTEHHVDELPEDFDDSEYAIRSWLEPGIETDYEGFEQFEDDPHPPPPPHHVPPPPHHGPPGKGKRPHPPHHGPGKRPPHPPHHKSNKTIYQLISESKYTTKLAKLIADDDDLVSLLNSTKANYTVFAPTDNAFKKIPKDHEKPSAEIIKKVLLYHVAPGLYPAGRVLFSRTVPTLLNEASLGDEPQRIASRISLRGITLNFYSRVVAINIGASNGLIHGIDSILIPPPKTLKILSLLPGEFSTLLLGLGKTGLLKTLNDTPHAGGTFFAPTNFAFKKLGPKINAFLFSRFGEKHLTALLKYHIVANQTLYQTAFYNGTDKTSQDLGPTEFPPPPMPEDDGHDEKYPYFHFDLPTLLDGKTVGVDVGRYGPFVSLRLNGFVRIVVPDGVAKDGVIHVPNNILIPPKTVPGMDGKEELSWWTGEEMSVEEFKERLEPLVEEDESSDSESDSEDEEREFTILPVDEWKDL